MELSKAIVHLRIQGYSVQDDATWISLAKLLKIPANPKTVQYEVSNCIRSKAYVYSLENKTVSKVLSEKISLRRAKRKKMGSRKRKVKEAKEVEYIQSDKFLNNKEWKTLRLKVRQHYKDICMKCLVQGGYANEGGVILHVDHIIPRKIAPKLALDFDNLQILCAECNKAKGNKNQIDYRKPEFLRKDELTEADKELLSLFKQFI